MSDEENDVGSDKIELTGQAWVILHTPVGTGLPVEDQYAGQPHDKAHAFGPFFSKDEVESWLKGSDTCTKFVIEMRSVRPMAIVGEMDPPPSERDEMSTDEALQRLMGAVLGSLEVLEGRKSKQREQRRKDGRN